MKGCKRNNGRPKQIHTKEQAEAAIRNQKMELTSYWCENCGGYHLTKHKAKIEKENYQYIDLLNWREKK